LDQSILLAAMALTLSLADFTPGVAARVYRYNPVDLPVTASGFTAVFPSDSITLVAVNG
jgi:hypothetical protein